MIDNSNETKNVRRIEGDMPHPAEWYEKQYADLLSRVREVRRMFESNKDKYQADVNSGVAGLAYMDVIDTIDRLIPEAKEVSNAGE